MSNPAAKNLLVISGLDPGGGAGFLADARIAAEHDLRVAGVVTVLTEQDSRGLREAVPVDPKLVGAQLRAILSDMEVAAIKIGALGTQESASEVASALALTAAPAVLDPVVRASSGPGALFLGDPATALAALMPHLALITPNIAEAEALSGIAIADPEAMEAAARALAAAGAAVLVKGGHLAGEDALDLLARGEVIVRLEGDRIPGGTEVHGTGCALSTAIASRLALGDALEDAVRSAKAYVAARLWAPATPGRGAASIV